MTDFALAGWCGGARGGLRLARRASGAARGRRSRWRSGRAFRGGRVRRCAACLPDIEKLRGIEQDVGDVGPRRGGSRCCRANSSDRRVLRRFGGAREGFAEHTIDAALGVRTRRAVTRSPSDAPVARRTRCSSASAPARVPWRRRARRWSTSAAGSRTPGTSESESCGELEYRCCGGRCRRAGRTRACRGRPDTC